MDKKLCIFYYHIFSCCFQRSVQTGSVLVDGVIQTKTIPEIFELYASITDAEERRRVFAPPTESSVGYCEIKEVIVSSTIKPTLPGWLVTILTCFVVYMSK